VIAYMRIGRGSSTRGTFPALLKLAVGLALGLAMLALFFVAFVVVLPVVLIGGAASYFYLRHRIRKAQQMHAEAHARAYEAHRRANDAIIDAEYVVVDQTNPERRS
jgi:uncharacterized membrane protein